MTHEPMRQADIDRRLSNLAKARRCGARTRAGRPRRQAAVTGRARCRMHGRQRARADPEAIAMAISSMGAELARA